MQSTATAPKINLDFAIANEVGPGYPWLQASDYRPRSLDERVDLCIPQEAWDLLSVEQQSKLKTQSMTAYLGKESVPAYVILDARWVILARPKPFAYRKEEQRYIQLSKGMNFEGCKSAVRLHLALAYNDEILLNNEGEVQIFTLKLSGMKTNWVHRSDRSIDKLNEALCKHWKAKRSQLLHLVSVAIEARPKEFISSFNGESSLGVEFCFPENDNARILPESEQARLFELVVSEDFQNLVKDPFGILSQQSSVAPQQSHSDDRPIEDDDDIPF